MNNKNIFISIVIILIFGALATVMLQTKTEAVPSTKYDEFAQCLSSKKLTMYGAAWCSHCKEQKALFGDSFKYVPYVECTENPDQCLKAGVEGYPTWIDVKGEKYKGGQSLEKLGEISNCVLPTN